MRVWLFLLASVALTTGCKKTEPKPEPNPKVEPNPVTPATPLPKAQPKSPGAPDLKLTVEELTKQAGGNPDKFAGKVIEVSGEVEGFAFYPNGSVQLQLAAVSPPNAPKGKVISFPVLCVMADAEPWAVLLPGQRTKITGTFAAEFDGLQVSLTGARITAPGDPAVLTPSPGEMLKAAAANRAEAEAKYVNKWMRVSGEVTELRPDVLGTRVVMKVDGATVEFVPLDRFAGAYKVGAKATAVGQVSLLDPNSVRLSIAFPVTKK